MHNNYAMSHIITRRNTFFSTYFIQNKQKLLVFQEATCFEINNNFLLTHHNLKNSNEILRRSSTFKLFF